MIFASVRFQRRRNVRLVGRIGDLPLLAYTSKGMEVKPLIHFHCVLHAKEKEARVYGHNRRALNFVQGNNNFVNINLIRSG